MSDPVTRLFDEKASSWASKYRRGGPLEARRARFLRAFTSRVLPEAPVLELGCGAGDLAAALSERRYRVHALDVSERMLASARERFPRAAVQWTLLPSDWTALPLDTASVDGAVASSVLEYVEDVGRVFREVARVLRPGGWWLFTVPDRTHPTRWVEAAARSALTLPTAQALVQPLLQKSHRLSGFARYLSVSRNRLSRAGWDDALRAAGLTPGLISGDAPETWGPLQLIFARRR